MITRISTAALALSCMPMSAFAMNRTLLANVIVSDSVYGDSGADTQFNPSLLCVQKVARTPDVQPDKRFVTGEVVYELSSNACAEAEGLRPLASVSNVLHRVAREAGKIDLMWEFPESPAFGLIPVGAVYPIVSPEGAKGELLTELCTAKKYDCLKMHTTKNGKLSFMGIAFAWKTGVFEQPSCN